MGQGSGRGGEGNGKERSGEMKGEIGKGGVEMGRGKWAEIRRGGWKWEGDIRLRRGDRKGRDEDGR